MIRQSSWRRVGAVTIGVAAVMAVYAVASDVLRDSILFVLEIFSGASVSSELSPSFPLLFLGVYWIVFVGVLGASMYCAVLDFRHIRLEYARGKREIFGDTIGNSEFRESLLKRSGETDGDGD